MSGEGTSRAELEAELKTLRAEVLDLRQRLDLAGRWRQVLDHAGLGLGFYDTDGTVLFYNRTALEWMGEPVDRFTGRSVLEIFGRKQAREYLRRIRLAAASRKVRAFEDLASIPTGDRWFLSSYGRIIGESGEVAGVLVASQDITAQKALQRDLEERAERLEQLGRSGNLCLWEWQVQTGELAFNDNCADYGGYEPGELAGEYGTWESRLHPDEKAGVLGRLKACLDGTADRFESEMRLRTRDGLWKRFRAWGEVVERDGYGLPRRMAGVLVDIERGKKPGPAADVREEAAFERGMATAGERFRHLYEKTPAMLHSIDREGRLVAVSDEWLSVMGYGREEVIGRKSVEFLTEPSARLAREKTLPRFFRQKQIRDVPYRFVKKSGETIDVLLVAVAELDGRGRYVRSLAVLTDVTGQKEVEEKIRRQEARLEEQNFLLEKKNIALAEVLERVRSERAAMERRIAANVRRLIMPLVSRLKQGEGRPDGELVEVLEANLLSITSGFGSAIGDRTLSLTPRELEICNLIKGGLSSKEIAGILSISSRGVEAHRRNIRKKLGLINKSINLATCLASLEQSI